MVLQDIENGTNGTSQRSRANGDCRPSTRPRTRRCAGPEPVPEPEPDFAQQIVVAVNALRDARLTHDDAPTRQRKADTAVADVEVQRTLAMSEQQKAVEFAEQSRSDVLAAYDGLITAVQAARDAFRAGIMEFLYSYGVWVALLAVAISLVWWSRRR